MSPKVLGDASFAIAVAPRASRSETAGKAVGSLGFAIHPQLREGLGFWDLGSGFRGLKV